jgi:cystathionine beta-synthase
MSTYKNVLDLIGNTPIVEVQNFDTGPCRLFVKMESQNPGGSIKDRIGLSMIEEAEESGRIKSGDTLIEATAGNTGLGLALVAALKGYKLILILPDKMSQEKIFHLRAMGAQVITTRSDVGRGHPEYYQDIAERLEKEIAGSLWINQFENPANPMAHREGTGPEIWKQMDHDVDAVICGVGSGGTLTGVGRFLKSVNPDVEMVLADPEGSILTDVVRTGEIQNKPGSWLIEGMGEDFVPKNAELEVASEAIVVSDKDSMNTARELLQKEGIFAGSSSGCLVKAALEYCRKQTEPKRVVTFICDSGNKYLSKMFNDYWMLDQGFLERETYGDLRDLITRRAEDGGVISVTLKDTLLNAYGRMRMYDVSQLPVLDGAQITGIIDESDILLAVHEHAERFEESCSTHMTDRLELVSPGTPVDQLMHIFRAGHVVLVVGDGQFHGLITIADFLNYHRRTSLR